MDTYGFRFLDAVAPELLTLHGLGLEYRYGEYDWDNKKRARDTWLFQYTLEGSGWFALDGKEYELIPGTGFLLNLPSESRYWLEERNKKGWRFIWIMFSGQVAARYAAQILLKYSAKLSLQPDSAAIECLRQMHNKARTGMLRSALDAQEMTFRFLCRLLMALEEPVDAIHAPVKQALEMIEKEFQSIQGATAIAQRLKISPEHLSRSFKAQTGTTIIEALTRARIRHGVQLLLGSGLSVEEIAIQCGYLNGNYFGKAFKRVVGTSPARFRREAQFQGYSDVHL